MMARIKQPAALKGSQYWLQRGVNQNLDELDSKLRMHLQLPEGVGISWVSPLEEGSYAEFRDDDFLSALGVRLRKRSLDSFWPRGGPVWDGLAKTSRGDVILVEAKSHIPEMVSTCAAGPENLRRIQDSLAETAAFYGSMKPEAWCRTYYQYANRLAHLYFLRQLNEIPAWLVFVYFVNDDQMAGPRSEHEWRPAIEAVHDHLDISSARLEPYVVEVFVDVSGLSCGESS